MFESAPLFDVLTGVPAGGRAYWLHTSDGVRIRAALWEKDAAKGTVFLFPGRTEWLEKYGPAAGEFLERGYAALSIDWRGQGIADRLLEDRRIGHVEAFQDYQKDLDAVIALAEAENMPKPWFLLGHSMGGAIGLRALITDKPFEAAAFSGPMWGIGLSHWQQALVHIASPFIKLIGKIDDLAPGTKGETYTDWHPFEDNLLTADPDMYQLMRDHTAAQPDLGLGGPSSHWVLEAIKENNWAKEQPAPLTPVICFLGGDEEIVNKPAVRDTINRLPNAVLEEVPKARHEFPMEVPQTRDLFYSGIADFFERHSAA